MKKYSGQAIAIIMVILVVAAVIGASLYSRMIRNKGEIIDTRESSKALEQSGNILDAFITSDIRTLQEKLYSVLNVEPYKVEIEGTGLEPIGNLTSNIDAVFGEGMIDIDNFAQMDASCSKYKMSFAFALPTEGIEYNVGDVMAINLSGVDDAVLASCSVDLTFAKAGNAGQDHLFTVKKVYEADTGGYEPYKLDDMLLYCLSGAGCTQVNPTTSLATWSQPILTISLSDPKLNEVRILPLKEKMEIGIVGNNCGYIFHQFLIKATSICSGQERTMQVVIPSATNYGYDPMFDYTIYNSNGSLSPVVIN